MYYVSKKLGYFSVKLYIVSAVDSIEKVFIQILRFSVVYFSDFVILPNIALPIFAFFYLSFTFSSIVLYHHIHSYNRSEEDSYRQKKPHFSFHSKNDSDLIGTYLYQFIIQLYFLIGFMIQQQSLKTWFRFNH